MNTSQGIQLAEEAFNSLNKYSCETLNARWKGIELQHTKTASESTDPDKIQYFENLALPYRNAREHLEKLIMKE